MKTIIHEGPPLDPGYVACFGKTDERRSAVAPARTEVYASAERRMRRGERLVITGFVLAMLGIAVYCVACAGVSEYLGASLLENPEWAIEAALGILGLGTLLWLVGLFGYLRAAMDSDPEGPVHSF